MKLNKGLYKSLLDQAKNNPRLRQALDLRTSSDDQSQRILNALIPDTEVPVHRHPSSAETVIVLYGCIDEMYYDENGNEIEHFMLEMVFKLLLASFIQ